MNNENEKEEMSFEEAQAAVQQMFQQSSEEAERNALADRLEEQQEQQAAEREQSTGQAEQAANAAADEAEQSQETAQQAQAAAQQATNAAAANSQQANAVMQENQQLRQALSDMQLQMRQANEALQAMQKREQQASDLQKQAIMQQTLEMPSLDMSELAFADEETAAQMQQAYADQMAKYVRGQVMREFEPYIKEANEARAAKQRDEIINALADDEAFSGIKESAPQILRLIGNNAAKFSPDLSEEEKIAMGYILSRGVDAIQSPRPEKRQPTMEELMQLYESNPEFQAAVEQKRIDSIKGSQQVPPMSASQGAANAALHIKEKPKSFDEAREGVMRLFGARQ